MTELLDREPVSGLEFLVAWLAPLGAAAALREADDPLPFRLVTRVAGDDDGITDKGIYQVDTMAADLTTAETEELLTHRRVLYLQDHPWTTVPLPSGPVAQVDLVRTFERPGWVDYRDETIQRMVARYRIDFRFDRIAA